MATMISEVYDAFRSVGIAEDKARAAAEALSEDQLATKADIVKLEKVTTAEIARLEAATKADIIKLEKVTTGEIARLEAATKSDIGRLEASTKADIGRLEAGTKADIARVEKELVVIKWMLGLVIVAVVIPLVRPLFS